jgi:predicted nucleic acid-binding protein
MPVLFDASIYISGLRASRSSLLLQRRASDTPLWLSAVVLEELYAGAKPADQKIVEKLEQDFGKAGRILVPLLSDWSYAGRILARLGQKYGYEQIGRAQLTNDALIVASASRMGIQVITANRRDFARLAEFCAVQWETVSSQ